MAILDASDEPRLTLEQAIAIMMAFGDGFEEADPPVAAVIEAALY